MLGVAPLSTLPLDSQKSPLVAKRNRNMLSNIIKQSTAVDVIVFMTDAGDHVSGLAGLTLTITASKAAAAFASISPSVTDRGNGFYKLALTTSHTDTLGELELYITGSGADPLPIKYRVVAIDVEDAAAAGLSRLDAAISSRLAPATAGRTLAVGTDNTAQSDVAKWLGTAAAAPTVAGIPKVEDATLQSRLTSTRAGYLDNLSAGAVALASSLTSLAARIPAALVGGRMDSSVGAMATDSISAAAVSTAAAQKIRDSILSYSYASGRTIVGYFRRAGASLERATGLTGSLAQFLTQAGVAIWSITQDPTNGTRTTIDLGSTEDPP